MYSRNTSTTERVPNAMKSHPAYWQCEAQFSDWAEGKLVTARFDSPRKAEPTELIGEVSRMGRCFGQVSIRCNHPHRLSFQCTVWPLDKRAACQANGVDAN